jgi:hypothetical protein
MYTVDAADVESADPTPEAREADRILRWRCEQFGRLGFTVQARIALAIGEADLALARKLIDGGCPPATAEQILL